MWRGWPSGGQRARTAEGAQETLQETATAHGLQVRATLSQHSQAQPALRQSALRPLQTESRQAASRRGIIRTMSTYSRHSDRRRARDCAFCLNARCITHCSYHAALTGRPPLSVCGGLYFNILITTQTVFQDLFVSKWMQSGSLISILNPTKRFLNLIQFMKHEVIHNLSKHTLYIDKVLLIIFDIISISFALWYI